MNISIINQTVTLNFEHIPQIEYIPVQNSSALIPYKIADDINLLRGLLSINSSLVTYMFFILGAGQNYLVPRIFRPKLMSWGFTVIMYSCLYNMYYTRDIPINNLYYIYVFTHLIWAFSFLNGYVIKTFWYL